jgi:hypothetical protein
VENGTKEIAGEVELASVMWRRGKWNAARHAKNGSENPLCTSLRKNHEASLPVCKLISIYTSCFPTFCQFERASTHRFPGRSWWHAASPDFDRGSVQ